MGGDNAPAIEVEGAIAAAREFNIPIVLVGDEDAYAQALQDSRKLLEGFSFVGGKTYAEYRQGDKMAGYGLAALIGGGAFAAAAKSGLLAKFFKRHPAVLTQSQKAMSLLELDPFHPSLRLHQLKLLIKTKHQLYVKHYLKQVSMLLTYKVLVVVVASRKKMLPAIRLNLLHQFNH